MPLPTINKKRAVSCLTLCALATAGAVGSNAARVIPANHQQLPATDVQVDGSPVTNSTLLELLSVLKVEENEKVGKAGDGICVVIGKIQICYLPENVA